MSYKLVDKVFKSRGIVKGTPKFVLAAMATRANDDGTQIYPSISELAADCGVTRDTVYESIDKLIAAGVLTDTGKKHFFGRGHYTTVYEISVVALSGRLTMSTDSTMSNTPTQHSLDSVESSDATLSSQVSDSVLKDKVSKEVSEGSLATLAPTDVRSASPKTNGTLSYDLDELRNQGWINLILNLLSLYTIPVKPTPEPDPEISACLWFQKNGWIPRDVASLWNWNLSHKRGTKLEFFSLSHVVNAIQSNSPKSAVAQWEKCRINPCRQCKPTPNAAAPPAS